MKKKNGFTLAEVLITLAIIGVVATLTLPALMSNTQEQQAITGFRKAMNTLNELGQMNAAVDGFDFSGVSVNTAPSTRTVYDQQTGILEQSVWGILASKAQVDVQASNDAANNQNRRVPNCGDFTRQAFFRDGTVLCYAETAPNGNASTLIDAVIDTNGLKAPNIVSTCTNGDCSLPTNRQIRDQFVIELRGAVAVPGRFTINNGVETIAAAERPSSAAARWAMRK